MGGAQYQIKCLLDHLTALNTCDIHYVARRAPDDENLDGYQVHRIGQGRRTPRLGYTADAPELYRTLKRLRPDVIYQRVGCAYTGVAALYATRHKARLVWHASSDADLARRSRIVRRNFLKRYLDDLLLSYGIRHADCVVVQSRQQARLLAENYSRTPDAIIANFHPFPDHPVSSTRELRVLWIANFKRLKQPEVFVRLARSLGDLKQVRFVMIGASAAGEGDAAWTADVLHQIADTPNVDYLGGLQQDQVNSELDRAYALVNTSLYEGFPNTFIQAWLREVPVLSLNVDPDGVLGQESVGIHAGDETALAASLRLIVTDRQLRDELAGNASRYARAFHSIDNARQLASLIGTLACGSPLDADRSVPRRAPA